MTDKRPTIAELEAILNSEEKYDVNVNPDGTVTAVPAECKDCKTTMERDARLIDKLDTVGQYLAGQTSFDGARRAYAALLYVRSALNLDAEEYRAAHPPHRGAP
jgi:hypothetical protein